MSPASTNVLEFPPRSTITVDTPTGHTEYTKPKLLITSVVKSPEALVTRISVDDLYPSTEAAAPELSVALRLLSTALAYVDQASTSLEKGNDIVADDAVQQLQALLPELFNCRALGDGYGAIINAALNSLRNTHGSPINALQLRALRQVLQRARFEPFIQFESALDEIVKLEESGFLIEPAGFEYLADWLDE